VTENEIQVIYGDWQKKYNFTTSALKQNKPLESAVKLKYLAFSCQNLGVCYMAPI
jgi:hypothetical protein